MLCLKQLLILLNFFGSLCRMNHVSLYNLSKVYNFMLFCTLMYNYNILKDYFNKNFPRIVYS